MLGNIVVKQNMSAETPECGCCEPWFTMSFTIEINGKTVCFEDGTDAVFFEYHEALEYIIQELLFQPFQVEFAEEYN